MSKRDLAPASVTVSEPQTFRAIAGGGKDPAVAVAGRDPTTSRGPEHIPVSLEPKVMPPPIEKMKLRSAGPSAGASAATATVPSMGAGPAATGDPPAAPSRVIGQAVQDINTVDLKQFRR